MAEAQDDLSLEEALNEAFDAIEREENEEIVETEDAGEVEGALEEAAEEIPEEAETEAATDEGEEELDVDEEVVDEEIVHEADAEPEVAEAAPDAWRPLAREAWNEVPPAAREEILRREGEIQKKLGEISDKSAQANAFEAAIEPFRQTIAIEAGGDPIAATRNLMGVATRLRMGTPQEKAMVVRDIITQYGVDIDTLAGALDQTAPTPPQNSYPQGYPQPAYDPRVDQLLNQQQMNTQQEQQRAQQEVDTFLGSKEWGEDVRNDMADLMDLAGRRGEQLTLEAAYDRAVAMRPDLQQILQQRDTVAQQTTSRESLKRKKRASKQISGSPAASPADAQTDTTLAGAISAAWDQHAS